MADQATRFGVADANTPLRQRRKLLGLKRRLVAQHELVSDPVVVLKLKASFLDDGDDTFDGPHVRVTRCGDPGSFTGTGTAAARWRGAM
jgi:hypothetical protein